MMDGARDEEICQGEMLRDDDVEDDSPLTCKASFGRMIKYTWRNPGQCRLTEYIPKCLRHTQFEFFDLSMG